MFLASEGEALATLEDGSPAADSWVRFACPTDAEHLMRVRQRILSDLRTFSPPGISLDFIRFFQFWEMTVPGADPAKLPGTCFCPRCRDQRKLTDHPEFWRQNIVEQTAMVLCAEARLEKAPLRIGIHCVPWKSDLYDGAITRVIGQNFGNLSEIGDYLTPMVYHHMMHREPSYITEFVQDMASRGCNEILPSIQVKQGYRTDVMEPEEFGEALGRALEGPSMGVLLYKWEDLADDPVRLDIVRSALKG